MTLAEIVKKLRRPILDRRQPSPEMLSEFAQMVELADQEWLKVPKHDAKSIQWAGYLTSKAKEQGWIRLCVQKSLLSQLWNNWPKHNATYPQEQLDALCEGTSVWSVSGGAFEQKRRKH